jgi:thioredoxin reductase (NADPH)
MRKQAIGQGAVVVAETVTSLEFLGGEADHTNGVFEATTNAGHTFYALSVILATGANARWLHVPNEDRFRNKGVSACAVCEGALPRFRNQVVAVIGGGDSAMEEAIFMAKYAKKVYVVNRTENFRASKSMLAKARNSPKIEFLTNATVQSVGGDSTHGLTMLNLLQSNQQGQERDLHIPVRGLFYAIGHIPNTQLVKTSRSLGALVELDDEGYVRLRGPSPTCGTTCSTLEGFFVAGDVADKRYRQAIFAAGTGCAASMDQDRWMTATVD